MTTSNFLIQIFSSTLMIDHQVKSVKSLDRSLIVYGIQEQAVSVFKSCKNFMWLSPEKFAIHYHQQKRRRLLRT